MTEGLENTDSGGNRFWTPLPLLIADEIGGVPVGRRVKEIPAVETETGINFFPFRGVSERKVQ